MPNYGAAGSQALNQLNNLPFDNIIGGPLNAAINAQAQAAETTVDFIQRVGMQEVNGEKEAINVQFVYEDSSGQSRRITVPILAIVPIPFIVIDGINIAFKAKITASTHAQSSSSKSSSGYINGSAGYRGRRFRASLNAGYSAKKDSKASQDSKYSVEYTMDVQVNASQAGLPAGMEAVLGFLQQGTHELPVTLQAKVNGLVENYSLPAGGTFATAPSFYLIVNDANNQPIKGLTATEVQIESSNGFIQLAASGGFVDGDADDGVYKITLELGTLPASPAPAAGDELIDELSITVNANGDVASLSRPINLRIVA
jgi:hypothetical protein